MHLNAKQENISRIVKFRVIIVYNKKPRGQFTNGSVTLLVCDRLSVSRCKQAKTEQPVPGKLDTNYSRDVLKHFFPNKYWSNCSWNEHKLWTSWTIGLKCQYFFLQVACKIFFPTGISFVLPSIYCSSIICCFPINGIIQKENCLDNT